MYRAMTAENYRRGLRLPPGYRVDALVLHGCGQDYPRTMMSQALGDLGHGPLTSAPIESIPALRATVAGHHVIWHALVYGGALTCELTHLACMLGARCAIFIGTCGGLSPQAAAADHVVPEAVHADESSTRAYQGPDGDHLHHADPGLSEQIARALANSGRAVWRGRTVTHQAQLAEDEQQIRTWSGQGYVGVEMEAASLLAPAAAFTVPAAAILVIADNLIAGQSMFDPDFRSGRATRRGALAAAYTAALPVLLDHLETTAEPATVHSTTSEASP